MPGGTGWLLVRVDLLWGVGSGTLAGPGCWVVFGTLLGPEATGPWIVSLLWWGGGARDFVSGFPGRADHARLCVGCVVWGCCLRTT